MATEPADNLALHVVLEVATPGDVLVVDGRGEVCGYWGEVLAVAAMTRGVSGLVIDGGVRDTARLRDFAFPVSSCSVAVRTTVKRSTGSVGAPIDLGGVTVRRGDVVVADGDGVVVLPQQEAATIVGGGLERERAEGEYLKRIREGELTLDIYGLRDK